ncbi:MAG: class F sortase [Actinomycetota bacterium]|nr:class F sortase [Actinomycetota bacterium]
MTDLQPPSGTERVPSASSPRRWWRLLGLVAAGLVLGVTLTLVLGQVLHPTAPPRVPVLQAVEAAPPAVPVARASTPVAAAKTPADLPVLPPSEVAIPKIGVRSRLVDLGLNPDGTLQVPGDFALAGWYSQGPAPGARGGPPALIVGHVDSYRGPAVFFRLKELAVGDRVRVRRIDGVTLTFRVYRTAVFPKNAFPDKQVYAPSSRAELRLITCTGVFDRSHRSYLSNFVAYATLSPGG